MTRRPRPGPPARWLVAIGVAVALAYAALASSTRPFTGGADVVTALPLAVAVVAMVVRDCAPPVPGPPVPPPTGAVDGRPAVAGVGGVAAVIARVGALLLHSRARDRTIPP